MSESKTLQIDEMPMPGGGVIGMCACPGRNQSNTDGSDEWHRNLEEDLAALIHWNADFVVTLVEAFEFKDLGVPDFAVRMKDAGFQWLFWPTQNLCAPDFSSLGSSLALDTLLDQELRLGKRIIIHCAAGKGRTGTLASALLIKQGWTASAAVTEVRRVRPGTIESVAQLDFLADYANLAATSNTSASSRN